MYASTSGCRGRSGYQANGIGGLYTALAIAVAGARTKAVDARTAVSESTIAFSPLAYANSSLKTVALLSVFTLPTSTSPYRMRVSATFKRRSLETNPVVALWLDRTNDRIT